MNSEFEGAVLLFRVLLPLVLGGVANWLLVGQGPRRILASLAVWLAFLVSDFGSRGLLMTPSLWTTWEAREPWMHWAWAGPLGWTLWMALSYYSPRMGTFTILALVFATLGVMVWKMFPDSPGYADQRERFLWLGGLTLIATLVNTWLIAWREQSTQADWLGWVQVAHLGCIALVVLQSYASLGEWMIFSASIATGGMLGRYLLRGSPSVMEIAQVTNGVTRWDRGGWQWNVLLGFAAVAGLSVSQVYAWNRLELWVLLLLAGFPSLCAMVDWVICKIVSKRTAVRLAGSIASLVVVLAILYFKVLQSEPQW